MHQFTVYEFQRNIAAAQDLADKEPLFITRNGREKYVLISADEYHRLKRLDREVLGIEDLSEQDISAIAAVEVPPKYNYLDKLLSK
jgi:PHD/YefM family antitoxin component YafN of YafNO toxin-antitoxin module